MLPALFPAPHTSQAVGFSLVPLMPSVWSLTALYFLICFSYNFTNSAVFTSLGWMFPKRAGSVSGAQRPQRGAAAGWGNWQRGGRGGYGTGHTSGGSAHISM